MAKSVPKNTSILNNMLIGSMEPFREGVENNKNEKIKSLDITLLDGYENHPFKVTDDKDMDELIEDIRVNGLIEPVLVREKEDRYEIISGHRRKRAVELLHQEEQNEESSRWRYIRARVIDADDDTATLMMINANIMARKQILPSEKAWAYKMKMEVIKRQGNRTDLASTPVVSKLKRSDEIVGNEVGESREQIRRFIRLTKLIPEIMNFCDEGTLKLRPAVEISYLSEESQKNLLICMEKKNIKSISEAKAKEMRSRQEDRIDSEGEIIEKGESPLSCESIDGILFKQPSIQVNTIGFATHNPYEYIPKSCKNVEEYIIMCLKYYRENHEK